MSAPDEIKKGTVRRVGVREFRGNLTGFLREVRHGSTILLTSHDEVLAELHPPSTLIPLRRQPGGLRGKIRMADDFDGLPADVLAGMEGEG